MTASLPTIDERLLELDRLADSLESMTVADRTAAIDNVLYFEAHVLAPEHPLADDFKLHSRALAAADPSDVGTLRHELHELVRKSMISGMPSSP